MGKWLRLDNAALVLQAVILCWSFTCAFIGSPALAQTKWVPGVGWEGQGAGMAITNLDGDPRPEVILMAVDNPPGDNTFRYRVGWNLGTSGATTNWSHPIILPGVGWEAQGAGIAVTNLDQNARPELIFMAYDNPPGQNTFRYRIGWNLSTTGGTGIWSDPIAVPGVGWEAQGASMTVTNLDGNVRPDLILMAYDNPPEENNFRYKIGWNVDANGMAASWTLATPVPVTGVGWEAQGAGMSIGNLDTDPKPELILMAYDDPPADNTFRYRIGWNAAVCAATVQQTCGGTGNWSPIETVPGVGPEGQGSDISVFNLDADARPDFVVMAYDSRDADNAFGYKIVPNRAPAKRIHLEMDRLTGLNWPPNNVVRSGATHSLQSIYAVAGITVNPVHDDGAITDTKNGQPYNDQELDAFRVAHMNSPGPAGTWHMYGAILTNHVSGSFGRMFDTGQRRAFAVFANEFVNNDRYLRTTAHELGHALNLEHSDGDDWPPPSYPTQGEGRTIMNQTLILAADWNYGWSASSLHHFYEHLESRWRPQSGVVWASCH